MARFRMSIFAVLFALLFSASVHALSVVEVSDEQLANKAEMIVIGKVLSAFSERDRNGDIVTYITVKVADQIKGKVRSQEIVLKTFGGRVGEDSVIIPGAADFFRNEEVLLFLERRADKSLMPIGLMLGKFSIYRDSETGKKVVLRHSDGSGQYFSTPREEETYLEKDQKLYLNEFRDRIHRLVGGGR